jgi:hypothetical protein
MNRLITKLWPTLKKKEKNGKTPQYLKSLTNPILMFNAPDFPLAKSEKRKF